MFSWLKGGPRQVWIWVSGAHDYCLLQQKSEYHLMWRKVSGILGRGVFPGSSRWVLSAVTCILLIETRGGSTPHSGENDVELEQRQQDAHKSGTPATARPGWGEREGGRVDTWPPERGTAASSVLSPQFTVSWYNRSPNKTALSPQFTVSCYNRSPNKTALSPQFTVSWYNSSP